MPKIMAMVSSQGTACSETALYEHEDTPAMREKIERECCLDHDDAPVAGSWRDCTEALSEYFAQDEAA
jgi:hypothetical protein